MVYYCQRCQSSTTHERCPRCGGLTRAGASRSASVVSGETVEERAAFHGLLVGLLVAQGLFYGGRHLIVAWFLWQGRPDEITPFWDSFAGLIVQQSMHLVSLLLGGMLAGSGHPHPLMMGVVLGVLNSFLSLGLQILMGMSVTELHRYGQPVLHAFVAGIGGLIGGRLSPPAPALPNLVGGNRAADTHLTTVLPERVSRAIVEIRPWGRMLLGALVAVGGTLWARYIQGFVILVGGGKTHEMQSQFITWEISVVAQVVGGLIAGANSRQGYSNGFWTGLVSAGVIIAASSLGEVRLETQETLSWILGLQIPEGSPASLMIQAGQALVLGMIGGWLGGFIIPATLPRDHE